MTEDDAINLAEWVSEKSLRAKNEPLTETQKAYLHFGLMDYQAELDEFDIKRIFGKTVHEISELIKSDSKLDSLTKSKCPICNNNYVGKSEDRTQYICGNFHRWDVT